nr:VP4 [Halorubrum pleomorphic virus 1]
DEFRTPAASDTSPEAGECSNLDDFIMFLSVGRINADSCSRQAYVDAAVQDMKDSDANQTKVDIYSAAAGVKGGSETWAAPYDNYLNDTESIAWMKAESAIAQSYSEGESKTEAKVAAKAAIADYYATKQKNLIEQWNFANAQMFTLREQARMEDGISRNYVEPAYRNVEKTNSPDYSLAYSNTTVEKSLVDGTTVNTTGVSMDVTVQHTTVSDVATVSSGPVRAGKYNNQYNEWKATYYSWSVEPASPSQDTLYAVHFQPYADRWQRIVDMNGALQSEADNFVNATWDDYDTGQINASDVLSANTAMSEYGVRSGSESEGLWRSTAALSMMGYDTPNLNNSGMMTVEYKNVQHTGLLMAKNAPNGSWQVNTTYNTSNIDGPVFMATTEGTKLDFADGEEFTIVGMTAKDGTAVNSTQTTKYRYKTANTTELLEVQNQLIELRQEIEDREPEAGGFFGSGSTDTMLVGLLALAGVLLLAQSNNRGGRR